MSIHQIVTWSQRRFRSVHHGRGQGLLYGHVLALSLVALFGTLLPAALSAQPFNCLPTCAEDDSRFLLITSGPAFLSMSDPQLDLSFIVPSGTSSFQIGIFDGDAAASSAGAFNWDTGDDGSVAFAVPRFEFIVLADPLGNVTGTQVVAGPFIGSSNLGPNVLPNNAWFDIPITTGAEAQTTSGDFVYRLHIELTNPGVTQIANAFKVRTSQIAVIEPIAQPFGYVAQVASLADANIIYPSFPSVAPTTYDGKFSFFFDVEASQQDVQLWGGDFDRGDFDGANPDTDDPNTPNAPFEPLWATLDTVPEGVSVGTGLSTGSPPDNFNPAGGGVYFQRQPTIRWDLISPLGDIFPNDNPSGNQEWEQFKVTTLLVDPTSDIVGAPSLPSGAYEMRIEGLDMANFNFLLFPHRVLCVKPDGTPCPPPSQNPKYKIGDTVFYDFNGNGVQDSGEPGISGVVVNLLGVGGAVIDRTVTDINGKYSFTVSPGTHQVQVAPGNVSLPTVGATLGDRVWLDANANGVDDAEPGIANVIVQLYTAAGAFVKATQTDANGFYLFQGLAAGSYRAEIVDFTLPNGLSLVTVLGASDPSSVRVLAGNGVDLTVDFPYANASLGTALVGDLVWSDSDGNGFRDPGELGIAGVTLELRHAISGVFVAETRTRDDGSYLFPGVLPGSYKVVVTDTAAVLAGYSQTFDKDGPLDGTGTSSLLVAGGSDLLLDFGYQKVSLPNISDAVWFDDNRNGLRDEVGTGLANVTVNLMNEAGQTVATTSTDANGNFTFSDVPNGKYTLEITDLMGVLAGLLPTTPGSARKWHAVTVAGSDVNGESFGWIDVPLLQGLIATTPNPQTNTVVNADVLTYDFGYWVNGACGVCDGKVTQLTLKYLGTQVGARIRVLQKDGSQVYDGIVNPGETFSFLGSDKKATLGTEIEIYVNGTLDTKIHTSCSQPIGPGQVWGSFQIISGASRNGGALCPITGGGARRLARARSATARSRPSPSSTRAPWLP